MLFLLDYCLKKVLIRLYLYFLYTIQGCSCPFSRQMNSRIAFPALTHACAGDGMCRTANPHRAGLRRGALQSTLHHAPFFGGGSEA
jgi:hypothetical protein